MKKIVFLSVLVSFLAVGGLAPRSLSVVAVAHAQTENEDLDIGSSGILPTNPFYFLKEWRRSVQRVFTRSPLRRAELELNITNQQAAEINQLEELAPENISALQNAITSYTESAVRLRARLEELGDTSENPNVDKLLEQLTERVLKHQQLFNELVEKFEAQESVRAGLDAAKHSTINVLGQIPEQLESAEKFKERLERLLRVEDVTQNEGEKALEVLEQLNARLPEQARESIFEVRERLLEKLQLDSFGLEISTSTATSTPEPAPKVAPPAKIEAPKEKAAPVKVEAPKPKVVVPPPTVAPPVVQVPPAPPAIPIKEIVIKIDDQGLHPAWVTVKKGEKVRIIFKVLMNSTDYEGYIFKTEPGLGWGTTGRIFPNYEEAVEFTADKNFEFTSQLYSGTIRGRGSVGVEE